MVTAVGFFSQDCIECGDSVIAPYDVPEGMAWQNHAVVITPRGNIKTGVYDGYGSVGDEGSDGMGSYDIGMDNTVYHRLCWEAAGSPMRYRGPSPHANDQGYFYERTVDTCARRWIAVS